MTRHYRSGSKNYNHHMPTESDESDQLYLFALWNQMLIITSDMALALDLFLVKWLYYTVLLCDHLLFMMV